MTETTKSLYIDSEHVHVCVLNTKISLLHKYFGFALINIQTCVPIKHFIMTFIIYKGTMLIFSSNVCIHTRCASVEFKINSLHIHEIKVSIVSDNRWKWVAG